MGGVRLMHVIKIHRYPNSLLKYLDDFNHPGHYASNMIVTPMYSF